MTSERNPGSDRRSESTLYWVLNNGPAIVTVLGSTAVTVAASVLTLTEIQLLQAVLALLALIGTSLLTERLVEGRGLRSRLSDIDGRLAEVLVYARDIEASGLDTLVIRRRDLPPLEQRLDGAKEVAISGGSLFRLLNEYQNLFEQLLHSGCKLRFLMTDPESDAAKTLSSSVAYESSDLEAYRSQMRTALASLTSLSTRHPNACQIRLCALAPPFSLMVVKRGPDSSSVQVEIYPFKTPARNRPMLLLDATNEPKLHAFFSSQFEELWSSAFCHTVETSSREPAVLPAQSARRS